MTPVPRLFKRAFGFFVLGLVVFFLWARLWQSQKVIEWDITLYYSYLPAIFIYDDIEFNERDSVWDDALFFMNTDSVGHRYVKMTSGLAYLYAPFFFGSHLYAHLDDREEANGFSMPYRFGLLLSDLVFAIIGLWFLGRILLRWFPWWTSFLSIVVIFLGTNMAYYTYVSPMSHVYSFALISMLLYWVLAYLDRQRWKYALLIGLAAGLIVLIRPTNIVAFILPLILLVNSRKKLDLPALLRHLAVAAILAFLVCLPQFIYWHHMTGQWLVYSYNGETFFFTDPEIIKGLFSYRKGWLVYSPVIIFGILGMLPFFRKDKLIAWGILLTMSLAIWITFSWWCWWYGGGFGARALIDFLPFMAIPMAQCLLWLSQQKKWLSVPAYTVITYFVFTSVFMSKQYTQGIIHFDAMTKEQFWRQYLVNHYLPDYDKYLDPPDYDAALRNEE